MRVLSVDVLRQHQKGRPVVNGFVSYISATEPQLMLCTGFEDYSDGYDDFSTTVSRDNGRTWSAPRPQRPCNQLVFKLFLLRQGDPWLASR